MAEVTMTGRLRSLRGWISPLLVAVALFFLLRTIVVNWQQVLPMLRHIRPIYLVPAVLLTLAMQLLMPEGWRLSLRWSGSELGSRDAFRIYYRSSIFRYVPGSLWYLPTRAILAQKQGVPLRAFTAASVMELVLLLGVATVLAGGALAAWSGRAWLLGISALSLLGFAVLLVNPAWLRRVVRADNESTARLVIVQALLVYVGIWLVYGASLYALLLGFQVIDAFSLQQAAYVLAANAAAWLAGFLSLLPAGIGIREVSLVALFSSVAAAALLLAISLLQRSIELLLEAGLWLAATLSARAKQR
jgi:glycosyltransferase 2 family protein